MRVYLLLVLFFFARSLSGAEPLFDLKKVAEGVYAAIARPAYKTWTLNCNAAVVVLEDGVLIVDTHSKPSAAQALIEQIKTVTDKPVRYVVDTHFHWDHYRGNAAYLQSYPRGVEIISSEPTRQNILRLGIPRLKQEILRLPKQIEGLKQAFSRTSDARCRAELEEEIRQTEKHLQELKDTKAVVPNMTLEKSLILYRKNRTVQILFMGRGHTDGDVVVFLPQEKVLATGDLLQGWMPYMGDSYPYEWIRTLEAIEKLDFERIIPGHGAVIQGKEHLVLWKNYLTDLMGQVAEQYARGATLEETRRNVNLSKYEPRLVGFREAVRGNIEKAYSVIDAGMAAAKRHAAPSEALVPR